jgi:uncharacterized protein YcbX
MRELGKIAKLWRYPVKSMLGEPCGRIELGARGVLGDRAFAVRAADGKLGSGKSTHRFRRIDGLFEFRALSGPVIVFPDGRRMAVPNPATDEALSGALGIPVTLARDEGVPHFDSGPVHIVTTASLRWLQAMLADSRIDERRFRPNIVVDLPGEAPVEQDWPGKTIRIGDAVVLRISEPTERCAMTTLAQSDLPADPRVLKCLARDADLRFGVYAEVLSAGSVTCGDRVSFEIGL